MKRSKTPIRVKSGPRMDGSKSDAQRRTITLFPEDLECINKLLIKHNLRNMAELIRFLLRNG